MLQKVSKTTQAARGQQDVQAPRSLAGAAEAE